MDGNAIVKSDILNADARDATIFNCADEPIHIPGSIQPHGALLAFDAAGSVVCLSVNAPEILMLQIDLGVSFEVLFTAPSLLQIFHTCQREMARGTVAPLATHALIAGRYFDCIAHAQPSSIVVEFELCVESAESVSAMSLLGQSAIARLKRQVSVDALLQMGVEQIRAITGFDRVMAYRFRDDDSGEVIAEDCRDGLVPYLGQRYPASDIPAQARRLYLINTVRIIVDVAADSVALASGRSDTDLDMSHGLLRSVSPIHIEYLRNMGVGASMSVSIVVNGRLWGLLACHHTGARQIPYAIRMLCDVLAQMIAATAQSLEAQADLTLIEQAVEVRAALIETLQGNSDVLQALFEHAPALCRSLRADAIVFTQHGESLRSGNISQDFATALVNSLPKQSDVVLQRTDVSDWPTDLSVNPGQWVGLLGLCFDPSNNGWMLALRREQIETVRWGGRPEKLVKEGPSGPRLTPRGSFDEWRETVRGKCEPWDHVAVGIAIQLLGEIHRLRNAELTRRATHDPLTGLPNRALIRERIASALTRSRRLGLDIALLFVDLDGFKLVNDSHGHGAGDFLLDTVAQRLTRLAVYGETVARLAGDEFVILSEHVRAASDIGALAERVNAALRVAVDFEGASLFVTASIGIAIGRGDTHSADDLLRYADAAMYSVKKSGRDGSQFFNDNVREEVRQRIRISNGLRTAIERSELSVRYQPIVIADSGRIVGAELLLRWSPPEGEVSPAVFIPIAEMSRVIVPIGAWVFEKACRAEVAWRARWGEEAPYVSVNLSVRQLNGDALPDTFAALLRATGANPTRMHLEITETALMTDIEANLIVLNRLAAMGFCMAVDDFGTGYSSLAQLTRLPLKVLKIDRAFVEGIDQRSESRTVARAIIGLGHALGLKIIAEGVETAAQQLELCAYACNFIQGYYFHRPLLESNFIDTVNAEMLNGPSTAIAPLHFLIYVSEACEAMSPEEMNTLVEQSQINNQTVAVTGCLLYHNGFFLQMLEGSAESIDLIFARIKVDPRHHSVQLVMRSKAERRIYTGWSMLLRDLSQDLTKPDFERWQHRTISFKELAEDARTCYSFLTGHVPDFVLY